MSQEVEFANFRVTPSLVVLSSCQSRMGTTIRDLFKSRVKLFPVAKSRVLEVWWVWGRKSRICVCTGAGLDLASARARSESSISRKKISKRHVQSRAGFVCQRFLARNGSMVHSCHAPAVKKCIGTAGRRKASVTQ